MTHRKHIHEREIDPVAEALRECLTEKAPNHHPKTTLPYTEKQQFRVLYRLEHHSVGQPRYPQPETWATLAQYLGVMVPNIQSTIGHQEQTPELPQHQGLNTAPGQLRENQCPSCGIISPNPNYCISCGQPMEVPAQ